MKKIMIILKNVTILKNLSVLKILIISILEVSLFSCCKKLESCPPPLSIHENIYNNLDWDNYNEVWDVLANNNLECSDSRVQQNNGRKIKVYGWLMIEGNNISITNDSLYALSGQREMEGRSSCNLAINCTPEIQMFIDTSDLTKKSYLEGKLKLEKIQDGKGTFCCQFGARIALESINNIYFEE